MTPMDPWDDMRRRARSGDFFKDFDREFEQMRAHFDQMFSDLMRNATVPRETPQGQPFVYGFSMRVGPDGKPVIQQFGNTGSVAPPGTPGPEPGREPITDVLEGPKEISITAELPGVEKADINLHVAEEKVTLRVDTPRRYHKEIRLPAKVKPETAKATYKNGILDLTVARQEPRGDEGRKVSVQ